MARTPLIPIKPLGPYPVPQAPAAAALDFAFAASDNVNGNQFPASGNDLLLVQNTNAAAQTFTITSAPDAQGRTADIATYSVGIGVFSTFKLSSQVGWIQPDGNIYLSSSNANIKFAIFKMNP
jgi:ABC-type nitrate/sulfonate/bicarbonate transport system substrate-binding protein